MPVALQSPMRQKSLLIVDYASKVWRIQRRMGRRRVLNCGSSVGTWSGVIGNGANRTLVALKAASQTVRHRCHARQNRESGHAVLPNRRRMAFVRVEACAINDSSRRPC
jgi:hypothetical protein